MDDRLVSLDAAIKEVESLVDTMSVCINMDECRGMRSMKRRVLDRLKSLPSAQPVEASMILGTSKDGVRLWYQCSACGEPVADADDNYCRNCGRKFING